MILTTPLRYSKAFRVLGLSSGRQDGKEGARLQIARPLGCYSEEDNQYLGL